MVIWWMWFADVMACDVSCSLRLWLNDGVKCGVAIHVGSNAMTYSVFVVRSLEPRCCDGLIALYVLMVRRNNEGQCLHGGLLGVGRWWPPCGISGSSTCERAWELQRLECVIGQNGGRLGGKRTSSCMQLSVRGAARPGSALQFHSTRFGLDVFVFGGEGAWHEA